MNRPASLVAGIFLCFIALAQFCRALFGIPISAAGTEIPVWISWLASIGLAMLGVWLLKERSRS